MGCNGSQIVTAEAGDVLGRELLGPFRSQSLLLLVSFGGIGRFDSEPLNQDGQVWGLIVGFVGSARVSLLPYRSSLAFVAAVSTGQCSALPFPLLSRILGVKLTYLLFIDFQAEVLSALMPGSG